MRSIESGMRWILGSFVPIACELFFLTGMLWGYCGSKYLGNMLLTLALYTYYTKQASLLRRIYIENKKDCDKKSEFYLNESIMNYETVKAFNNEKLEEERYADILDKLKDNARVVQTSLSWLNNG
jgi:ABC-type transport system involved in Fe-S cluster assembly fused permease/ATPase subunit